MPSSRWLNYLWQKPVAAALAWAIAVALLFHRLPFGTSYGDESYYNAMPYSFAIGSTPYVDELGVFQNAGILLMPFYRVYIAIAGSGDGLILFNRYLYFIYAVVSSLLAFRFVRRIASASVGLCIAALVVSFSYFNLFALSYNTCGAFGLFCGLMCTANALLNVRPGLGLFGASLFCLSALFGYPGLAPVVILYLLIVLGWLYRETPRESFRNGLLGLGLGVGLAVVAGAAFAARVGQPGFARLLAFTRNMGYAQQGILQRLNVFGPIVHAWRWVIFAYVGLFVAVPLVCRFVKSRLWLFTAAAALAAAFAFCYQRGLNLGATTTASICLTAIPVLAPACIALNKGWKYGRLVLMVIWLPSFLSMIALTYTSSNNFYAAHLGVLGALVAGFVSVGAYVEGLAQRAPERWAPYQLVFAALVLSLLVMEQRAIYAGAYSEQSYLELCDTRVRSGPFRGLLTSRAIADFVQSVDQDLKNVEKRYPQAKSLTVFDDFSAGYMSTRLKPRTFASWILWGFFPPKYGRAIAKETFGSSEKLPDILLEVHVNPTGRGYWERYVRGHYRAIIRRPDLDYVILKKRPAPKSAT